MSVPIQADAGAAGAGLSLRALHVVLLHRRRIIARVIISVVALVIIGVVLRPPRYTSTLSFTAQNKRAPSSVAGLAAQFGLNVSVLSGAEGSATSQFYVDLLESDGFLRSVIQQPVDSAHELGLATASIPDLMKIDETVPAKRVEKTIPALRSRMSVSLSVRTGVVQLSVRSKDPQLSNALARDLFHRLDEFNQAQRTEQASSERRFLDARAAALKQEVANAEAILAAFLRQNRDFRNSPDLQFRYETLQREVQLRSQVLSAVSQTVEQTRIDEQRDTPVLSLVTAPIPAPLRDPRHLAVWTISALLGAIIVCLVAALPAAGRLVDTMSLDELVAASDEAARTASPDLRNPFRLLFHRESAERAL